MMNSETISSVVLVCVMDTHNERIVPVSAGSGFIVDANLGLVVTAAHVFFHMEASCDEKHYGTLKGSTRAAIGVIPDQRSGVARFRYVADLVGQDMDNVDACVLRITSRVEKDIFKAEGTNQLTTVDEEICIPAEELTSLEMTYEYSRGQNVCIAGFNQGGGGLLELGKHICPAVELSSGSICGSFKVGDCIELGTSKVSRFIPNEAEIVVEGCPTIEGLSGGPCLTRDGTVVGILSRAHASRSYVVPSSVIKALVNDMQMLALAEVSE